MRAITAHRGNPRTTAPLVPLIELLSLMVNAAVLLLSE